MGRGFCPEGLSAGLSGVLGNGAGHFFLDGLELLGRVRIVAGHLFLAGLELLDPLSQGCEIARHRLEQLSQLRRRAGGGRRGALRCALSQKRRL